MENQITFRGSNCKVILSKDNRKRWCVRVIDLEDGFPYTSPTFYSDEIQSDEIGIKNYSENEGILDLILDLDLIEKPHRYIISGYVSIPVCKIKIK